MSARQSLSLRRITGHCTVSADKVYAWYRLAPQGWSFRSDEQDETLVASSREGWSVPVRVSAPTSRVIATWRAPWWQRIIFPAVGAAVMLGSLWPYAGEVYEPVWWALPLGAAFVMYPLRPRLRLHEDALHVRGVLLSRVIAIADVSAVQGGYGGLDIWWGEGRFTEVSTIGEQNNVEWLPGGDGRRYSIRDLILETRDTYLREHGLQARPDPRKEQER